MSKAEEKKYRVTSPIKRNKKRYEVGDTILLTEEEAEGLHVELDNGSDSPAEKTVPQVKPSPSSSMKGPIAIKHIESTDWADLEGFVITDNEGGSEDRKTVKEAWAAKAAEAEESSKKKK